MGGLNSVKEGATDEIGMENFIDIMTYLKNKEAFKYFLLNTAKQIETLNGTDVSKGRILAWAGAFKNKTGASILVEDSGVQKWNANYAEWLSPDGKFIDGDFNRLKPEEVARIAA